jgi:(S)-mandelate dehydrogenase
MSRGCSGWAAAFRADGFRRLELALGILFNAGKAVTIGDLRNMARRRLPDFAFVPMETGSGDGSGTVRNVEAFRKYLLSARALVDVTCPDQEVTVFGQRYSCPFGISAVGYAGNLRRNADELLAEAAAAANIPFMLSGGSHASIETIARLAPHHVWQQLYVARDAKLTENEARRPLRYRR